MFRTLMSGDQLSLDFSTARRGQPNGRPASGLRRMTVVPEEAAAMLGVSRDFFDEHVKPELRIIRRGPKKILIPVHELERWIERSATRCG